jgi:multidrug efflux system membrane fusion protein
MRRSRDQWRYLLPLLLPIGASGCDGSAAAPAELPSAAAMPVRVEAVHLEPAQETVRYAAVIRPRIEAELGFRVGGKIVARLVEVGSRVEAGTPLARLDPADLQLQLRAVEAQLVSAGAEAANAKADFARYAQLRRGEWATQQEHDKRKTAMEAAAARVRELEAQRRVAGNNAEYTTLVADTAGVVTAVLAEPGQVVAQGQTVLRLARFGELEAVANLPESQIGRIEGAAMTVSLWALPGVEIAGKLRELAPAADAATRTYQARVTLLEPPPGVQLGMTATLVARRPRADTIVRLPMEALAAMGTAPAVWVVDAAGGGIALRPVEIDAYAGDRVLVRAGLADGERVVTAGVHKLDASRKIRIWSEPLR